MHLLIGLAVGGVLGALMGHFGQCTSGGCPLTANPYRGAVYGMFMGLLFVYTMGSRHTNSDVELPATESSALIHVDSQADFNRVVLAADRPVLVDFFSNSCPPCRRLSPTISELADEYKDRAVVCKVNLDRAPELAQSHSIRGIPAILFFVKGKEVDRIVGLRPKSSFVKKLNKLMSEVTEKEPENATL